MCLTVMDAKSKHIKNDSLFKNMKPGSKLRWKLLRVTTEENEALKHCRASAVRATIRKYLRRQTRRDHLAKLAKVVGSLGRTQKRESACEGSPATACMHRHPPGAMAPENTTQYLMSNVYEDMKADTQTAAVSYVTSAHIYDESLSPSSVYAALDSDCESSLAFQQRDFEDFVFGLCW